jgi:hypothetical protein
MTLVTYSSDANADIFAFQDIDGFEKCLQSKHLVETVKTKGGEQSRFLNAVDIQERCFLQAKSVLAAEKSPKVIQKWIQTGFKNSHNDNAIDLIALQVKNSPEYCNDTKAYDVFLSIMAMPSSSDTKSMYYRGKSAIIICLKNKTFRTDFLEEQDSSKNGYVYKNVCQVLREAKLIKKCFGE